MKSRRPWMIGDRGKTTRMLRWFDSNRDSYLINHDVIAVVISVREEYKPGGITNFVTLSFEHPMVAGLFFEEIDKEGSYLDTLTRLDDAPIQKVCSCDIMILMSRGCQCGNSEFSAKPCNS